MSVLNPFQVSRSHLHSHAHQLQQWIASGHTQLPTSLQSHTDDRASSAVTDSSAASSSSSSASVIYPDSALRAPCFYQLFPQMWKKGRNARPTQFHSSSASPSATASSASIAGISTSATAAAAAYEGSASATALSNAASFSSNPTSAANAIAPAPKLKLRARSPSLSLMHSLGACHSRLQHEAGFAEALSLATPHVSAQLSNVNPNNQLEDGAPNDAVQPISPTIPPGSSLPLLDSTASSIGGTGPRTTLHRRASKFHKPVGEMGDYTTLMRNTVYLRNPYIDQLDDPAFIAYITHNLQMAAREKQQLQQQQQQQQMLMNQNNDGSVQDTTNSPSTDSTGQSPSRLAVDEADLSEEGGSRDSSSASSESFNNNNSNAAMTSPSPLFRRRNRNANGSIGRNIPRVSFQQFVQNKANNNGASNNNIIMATSLPATPATIGEEESSGMDTLFASGETVADSNSQVSSSLNENGNSSIDSRDSKRIKLSNDNNPTVYATMDASSASDSTVAPSSSSSLSLTATSATSDEFTPSITSLVSSMQQQQQQAKANAQARATANRELSAMATVSLPPGAPTAFIILQRLKLEVPMHPKDSSPQSYLAAVKSWFIRQLLDLRSSRSCNEQTFGSSNVIPPQLERVYQAAYDKWQYFYEDYLRGNHPADFEGTASTQLQVGLTWNKIKMAAMDEVVAIAVASWHEK